jgi:hypothetical protein
VSESFDRWVIIGNPENRRVVDFARELPEEPTVFAHRELIPSPEKLLDLPDTKTLVRIDATGEDDEVTRLLLGQPDLQIRHGEIVQPRRQHRGFLCYLDALEQVFARRPSWRILNPPKSVALAFDKAETSRRLSALGLPVAPAITPAAATPEALRDAMNDAGVSRVFVKLNSGSSASCLAAYSLEGRYLMTTVEVTDDGWYNSRRVRRARGRRADEILAFILGEGAHVERALPKAKLDGAYFDLRVLVIAGDPAFFVVRQNTHPITNLQLGGWRGDSEHFLDVVGAETWAKVRNACARASTLFDSLHIGLDVMFARDLRSFHILEANAFGDLLPGLERGGKTVYAWEIARATSELSAGSRE